MGLTKSEIFTDVQNKIATLAKAFAHPARVAILHHLFKLNTCIFFNTSSDIIKNKTFLFKLSLIEE